jgi:hypothetical protein
MIRANGDYSLLLTEGRRCFVSDTNSIGFIQIQLESGYVSNCFLGPHYAVLIDTNRNVHFSSLTDQNVKFQECTSVKILENSNFIGFCCNKNKIWALNSKRQAFIADLSVENTECKL